MRSLPHLLLMAAVVIFLVMTAPRSGGGGSFLDHLLTFALVAAVWIAVRRQLFSRGMEGFKRKPADPNLLAEDEEETAETASAPPPPLDMGEAKGVSWTVVEQGDSLGTFRQHPIPAWIRTSDGRQAFYAGITQVVLPEEFACVEFPSRGEIIIPPGIIYALGR